MIENVLQLVNFSCSKKKNHLGFSDYIMFSYLSKSAFSNYFKCWIYQLDAQYRGGQFLLLLEKKNRRWLFRPHYVHTCRSQYFQAMHCIKMLELPTGRRASKWSQGLVLLFCFLLVNKHNKIAISCS